MVLTSHVAPSSSVAAGIKCVSAVVEHLSADSMHVYLVESFHLQFASMLLANALLLYRSCLQMQSVPFARCLGESSRRACVRACM
jgi:hypothetical protein